MTTKCVHGIVTADHATTRITAEGKTICCDAFTSIFIDDGTEYCKCCFNAVIGLVATSRPRMVVDLGDPDFDMAPTQAFNGSVRKQVAAGIPRFGITPEVR